MPSRQSHLNSRAKGLGDILLAGEKQVGWHKANDLNNIPFYVTKTYPVYVSSMRNLTACLAYLNEMKRVYNLHIASTDAHQNADSTNDITSNDATSLATGYTLANELKLDFNAHIAAGVGGAHTHTFETTVELDGLTVTNVAHTHTIEHTHDLSIGNNGADAAGTRVNATTGVITTPDAAVILIPGLEVPSLTAGGVVGVGEETVTGSTVANGTISPNDPVEITGTTDAGGASGASDFHGPLGDNINTILSADATTEATLFTLTLELITNYRNHCFIGPFRMGEYI